MTGAVILSALVGVVLAGLGESPRGTMVALTIRLDQSPEEYLLLLDGMPEKAARRLPVYRAQLNPNMPHEDLRRVPGLGSSLVHPWWPWLGTPPNRHSGFQHSPPLSPKAR